MTEISLRPDVVLQSETSKQVVILELPEPWEDRMAEANERATCTRFCSAIGGPGRQARSQWRLDAVALLTSVLYRAYSPHSGVWKKKAIKTTDMAAELSSRWQIRRICRRWRLFGYSVGPSQNLTLVEIECWEHIYMFLMNLSVKNERWL